MARSIHVLCVAGLFGGHVFGVEPERITPWLLATVMTGLVILLLDLFQSGAFLLQVRGAVLYAKIALLLSTQWLPDQVVPLLGSIMVLAVLSSHAPSKVRYFLLFGRGRVAASKTPG